MISTEDWNVLESTQPTGAGTAVRRIAPTSDHDLFVGVRFPARRRQLIVEVPEAAWPKDLGLPVFKSLDAGIVQAGGIVKATVELQDPALSDVFTSLANDVAQHVAAADGHAAGVAALVERLERWRRLMEPDSAGGMTREERRGLFGELRFLQLGLQQEVDPSVMLTSWVGPLGAHQDFQHPSVAVEVKATSTAQPQALAISSERQLDSTGISRLALVHLSLDERAQGAGQSLPALIEDVRSSLGSSLEARFDSLLTAYGWLPGSETRYQSPLYTERSLTAYSVVAGFPRLTEADCPVGVGDVRYVLQLGALTSFEQDPVEVLQLMGEKP